MDALMTAIVIAVVLFGWFCLIWVIPNSLLSLFRYRLWRMRDGLYDEIRAGKFHGTKQAYVLVEDMECFIERAKELSPLNIALILLSHRRLEVPKGEIIDMSGMDARDKRRLTKHLENFQIAIIKHVFYETPSGWILTLPALPFIAYAKLSAALRRLRNKKRRGNGNHLDRRFQRRVFGVSFGILQAAPAEHHSISHAV